MVQRVDKDSLKLDQPRRTPGHPTKSHIVKTKIDGKEKTLISTDLKLRHKDTQYLYTVVSVGPRDVILKTPEGKQILIDKEELEKSYEID